VRIGTHWPIRVGVAGQRQCRRECLGGLAAQVGWDGRPTDTESGVPKRSELEPRTGLAERDGGAAERDPPHGRRLHIHSTSVW
jgi:hypothetical protein